jgi:hypothetical protein
MADILHSQNVHFIWDTQANRNSISLPHGLQFTPDVAIVRQISYIDQNPLLNFGQYYIWSSIRGGNLLGSFNVSQGSTTASSTFGQSSFLSNPQTFLSDVRNIGNNVTFQIQQFVAGAAVNQTTLLGSICVQIDFLKFKST